MATHTIEELVLVYNADAGLMSALVDSAKKIFQVNGCTLCALTHGVAGERSDWKECKAAFGVPIAYFHRDDMPADLNRATTGQLPAVLARVGREYVPLLGPETLARCNGKVVDLKGRIRHHARLQGLELP